MKRYFILILTAISIGVSAQVTVNPTPRTPVSGFGRKAVQDWDLWVTRTLKIPFTNSPTPVISTTDSTASNVQLLSNGNLAISKGFGTGFWTFTQGATASNLSLGTPTTTTYPILNSNGTGVTLPVAVAGVSAGLLSSTGATVLGNTSGTNSGNQTISASNTNGVTLSASGGSVVFRSLSANSADFPDANTLPTAVGFFPYINTTGSTNYPAVTGGGIKAMRTASSGLGYFEFNKEANASDALYFRVGTGTSSFSTWDAVAGRNYVTAAIAAYQTNNTSGAGTLTLTGSGFYSFTGSTATWTLPAISGNTGVRYVIMNTGSGSITVNSNAGANVIYSPSLVNTISVATTEVITLYNNGTYWIRY